MKLSSLRIACLVLAISSIARAITVRTSAAPAPCVSYAADRLVEAMKAVNIAASVGTGPAEHQIIIGRSDEPQFKELLDAGMLKLDGLKPGAQGYALISCPDGTTAVVGADDSGTLYGSLELAHRIHEAGQLPANLRLVDSPSMIIRGTCIGMQKTYLLPGRKVYEYPYTPQEFPFFYDEAFWKEYFDFLADNRMNTLYLWNGHPFASLVRLKDYPYAVEVPDDVFEQNQKMYQYIVREAEKHGVRVVQMFYNILLSKPFAEKNHLETQLKAPTPIAADYTRKSIAEFVKTYPNVGLMVCLGEALQGDQNQIDWLTQTIIPGIKDGMALAGLKEEPPLLIRTHAMDGKLILPIALKLYGNISTEAKYNGESLTTWEPRGVRQDLHLTMSKIVPAHLINVHILANLEPFRYGAQRFIKKSVQAAESRLGAKGVHLYPLAYWDWPISPDKTATPLKQIDRDWIWFEAWSRYAWNPNIDDVEDRRFWVQKLTDMYGTAPAAEKILDAYNDSGECAPRLLRRFGITEGNRQTLSLGMTLDELVNPKKYGEFEELWESQAPPGERLNVYIENEWNKKPHEGETPPQIIREVLEFSKQAVDEIEAAAPNVSKNREEFDRLRNDVNCIRAMSQSYAAKAEAAECVLRYKFSHDSADMKQAAQHLAESLEHYRKLVDLTKDTYRYANTMQTSQRKIPLPGGSGGKPANYLWSQLLPVYEKELTDFQKTVADLK